MAANDDVLVRFANLGFIGGMVFRLDIAGVDCSDAPIASTSYGTASHIEHGGSTLRLGAANDDDTTDISSSDASGDGAEDDGVASFPTLAAGDASYSIAASDFNAGAGSGTLYAWIDFDGNDAFDTSEFASVGYTAGVPDGPLNFSGFTAPSAAGTTFARFRLTGDPLTSSDFSGDASDGEVEDYALTLSPSETQLSGTVFIDNGAAGGTAHDALIASGEITGSYATISIAETAGDTEIATAIVNADGTWNAILPAGFSSEVRVTATPSSAFLTISEATPGLPALGNTTPTDGTYTFTPAANTPYAGLDFGVIAAPVFSQNQSVSLSPGQVTNLPHRYEATSTGDVTFALVDQNEIPAGAFNTTLFLDNGCDGTPDTVISGPISVTQGQSVCILARTQVSGGAGANASLTYGITADTAFTGTAVVHALRNDDSIGAGTGEELVLRKLVRNTSESGSAETTTNTGKVGDILEYRIIMSNPSTGVVRNVKVNDATPEWTTLAVPIVSPVTVAPGVNCTVTTPNTAGYAGPIEWDCSGDFPPGGEASVTFRVSITP